MNKTEIKQQLEEQKRRLQADIEDLQQQDPSRDAFRDVNNTDDDDAAESEDHSRIQAHLDQAQAQLKLTVKALEKLEAGTYGQCERCGKTITPARLEAKPWAIYDIECEELIESGRG
jgi:RNA polymerase-binding transcription factor DksA